MNLGRTSAMSRTGMEILFIVMLAMVPVNRAGAQILPAAAGGVGGLIAGTIVTTGTVVLEARLGRYIYGLDDLVSLRPELFPIFIGPVAGAVLGARSPSALRRAGIGGVVGLAGGAAVGAGVGTLLGTTSEARWAGGIIGGAAGMLAGSIIYASRKPRDTSEPVVLFSVNLPRGKR